MKENEGYEIRHNGIPRSYRDKKEAALDAARCGKERFKDDKIEVIDRSTGEPIKF
jgi:hypothetical protein